MLFVNFTFLNIFQLHEVKVKKGVFRARKAKNHQCSGICCLSPAVA